MKKKRNKFWKNSEKMCKIYQKYLKKSFKIIDNQVLKYFIKMSKKSRKQIKKQRKMLKMIMKIVLKFEKNHKKLSKIW